MTKEQKQSKLFEYSIFWTPNEDQSKKGEKAKILIEPKVILAVDESTAYMQAVREIPADKTDELEQITVALRPF